MIETKFDSVPSWSVEYNGFAHDDARNVDGLWYFRHPIDGKIRQFVFQNRVVPLYRNPPAQMFQICRAS